MSRFRALSSHRFLALTRTTLSPIPRNSISSISTSPELEDQILENKSQRSKKPLVDIFKESAGLQEKIGSESEGEDGELKKRLRELEREVRRLKSNPVTYTETPKKTELKKDGVFKEQTEPGEGSLSSLFKLGKKSDGKRGGSGSLEKKRNEEEEKEPVVLKDIPEDMMIFLCHLQKEGYFKDANFLPKGGKFIHGAFDDSYSRAYIKFAAEKFGKDNQEIAK